jgi:hypothetical protein
MKGKRKEIAENDEKKRRMSKNLTDIQFTGKEILFRST